MSRLFALVVSLLALAGCVSTKNIALKPGALGHLEGGTVVVSHREKPSFSAMTAGKAAFGMLGAIAMITKGNELVKENNVPDPAEYIGVQLAADIVSLNNLKLAPTSPVVTDTTDPSRLAKLYSGANVLLDVQTTNWSFGYFPTDWNSYRVMYSAKARLIDTHSGKLLAEAFCSRVPEKTPDAPSYDDLISNGAAGLKTKLTEAANQCLTEFRSHMLGV